MIDEAVIRENLSYAAVGRWNKPWQWEIQRNSVNGNVRW